MLAQAGPTVSVFTAGDHFAGHEKPAEAEPVLELMLNRCGYTKDHSWKCRVDKMKHCSAESRPIRIVGFKNYGIIMRVKPQVNSTIDYQMTLLVPEGSGYSAKNLFDQLKANEKSISRWVRQQEREEKEDVVTQKTTITLPVTIEPTQEAKVEIISIPEPKIEVAQPTEDEYRPVFSNLRNIVNDPRKLRYILLKVQTIEKMNFCHNKAQFMETLKHECKWVKEGHASAAASRVMSEFVKHEYLTELEHHSGKLIGYTLTEKGKCFILRTNSSDTKCIQPIAPKKEEIKADVSELLIKWRDKLQELSDVANRIAANNVRKADLQAQINVINKENEELSKVLDHNKESQDVLNKLGKLITTLPLQGDKNMTNSLKGV